MPAIRPYYNDDPLPSNAEVAALLREIAHLLSLEAGDRFRQQAYAKAADIVEAYPQVVAALPTVEAVMGIPGIQEPVAERIVEYRQHGSIGYLEHLRRVFPPEMRRLMAVPGIDAPLAKRLYREMAIDTLRELETAARSGRLRARVGRATEAMVLAGLAQIEHPSDRVPLGQVLVPIRQIIDALADMPGVSQCEVAGSARRWQETVGDLNFVAATEEPTAVLDAFAKLPLVDRVDERGRWRVVVNLSFGLRAELQLAPPACYGNLIQLATGSPAHNDLLQRHAMAQGWRIEPNSLVCLQDGHRVSCADEAEVYQRLGLHPIPPEMREGEAELAWALAGQQPPVISPADLRGDLHVHGAWDDGGGTLLDIAEAARQAGYQYVAVTTHVGMGHARHDTGHFDYGADLHRLRRQFELIDRFNRSRQDVRLIKGIEVEIGPTGELLWHPECRHLAELVVACISSREEPDGPAFTQRFLQAMQSGDVDVIAHPTGRLINQRTSASLDWPALLPVAVERAVAWEINAHWRRLDLNMAMARQASQAGALLAIGSDAHHPSQFGGMAFGLAIARRGFLPVDRIVNTWTTDRLMGWLQRRRQQAA